MNYVVSILRIRRLMMNNDIRVYKVSPFKVQIECHDEDLLHLIYLRLRGMYAQ